jgi:hypothetical protein
MLVGLDEKEVLRRRLEAAGARVIRAGNGTAALDCARHQSLDAVVLVSTGALIDDAETAFNLRDLNRRMEIIIVVDRISPERGRLLRQLVEHPIAGTRVVTRRMMQKQLNGIVGAREMP